MPLYNQLKRVPFEARHQPDRPWENGGGIETDYQPDREGRLFTVGDTGVKTCKNL